MLGTTRTLPLYKPVKLISIHVPVLGTTKTVQEYADAIAFQSTFPCWERLLNCQFIIPLIIFQSTFPCWERHSNAIGYVFCWINFNPRSRVGNDICERYRKRRLCNFNPRSRVGNDKIACGASDYLDISIHVPVLGTTLNLRRI